MMLPAALGRKSTRLALFHQPGTAWGLPQLLMVASGSSVVGAVMTTDRESAQTFRRPIAECRAAVNEKRLQVFLA